jgi:hypothetical protein
MSGPRANGTRPLLRDDVLRRLCGLSTVDGRVVNAAALKEMLHRIIDNSWNMQQVIALHEVSPMPIVKDRYREVEAAVDVLQTAFDDLKAALNAPQALTVAMSNPRAELRPFEQRARRVSAALRKLASTVDRFGQAFPDFCGIESETVRGSVSLGWHIKLYQSLAKPQPSKGRSHGSKKHWACRYFVRDLLIAVANAGGDLRFDKDNPDPERGLLGALYLLAPYVPPDATCDLPSYEPVDLPPGMPGLLAEIRKLWRAEVKEALAMQSFLPDEKLTVPTAKNS